MPCEEQLKACIRERGHAYMITAVAFVKASHTEEEIKQ